MEIKKEGEARQYVDRIYPKNEGSNEVRQKCLTIFAEAINEANTYGRNKWVVKHETNNNEPNKVRLQVGGVNLCTLEHGSIWMALDKQLLETLNLQPFLEGLKDWKWDSPYTRIPAETGYYLPSDKHEKVWPIIKGLHFQYIYKAGRGTAKPVPEKNSPEILKYLRNELGRHVPDPLHP